MLPHKHFLAAGLTIAPAAVILSPGKSMLEVDKWALAGGLLSAAIDLDVYAIVLLKSNKEVRLRPFMDAIAETGVLKSAIRTHFILSLSLILVSCFFWKPYFIPVTLGIVSHILSYMPNILRVIRAGNKCE